MTGAIARLRAAGVSVWLDDLSREWLTSGSLAALRDRGVSGVTTNPAIFARAIEDSDAYADQIRDLKLRQVPADQALREPTASDVRRACDVLRPVYEATGGVDGRASIEVDPRLAHNTGRTVAEVRALWWLVDRPNLFVKIPAARQGLPAIAACLAEGVRINVTLIFSLARYGEVIEAFLAGLERAREAGHDLSGIASVASFFVSRVDTEVDRRLDKIGTEQAAALRGKAAIANAGLAYQRHEQAISMPAVEVAGGGGSPAAAPAMGLDQRQGPRLRRHPVRHRPGRAGCECLRAADELAADGLAARIIDLYSVKPIDQATLEAAASATGGQLAIAEDHYPQGGLGAAVLEALVGLGLPLRVRQCAVGGLPGSGTPEELMDAAGISASRIAGAVRALVKH